MTRKQLVNQWQSPEERFHKQTDKNHESGCWLWIGAITSNGYGNMKIKGLQIPAHRFSYKFHYGSIPEGLCVLHKCDVRNCVNPDHLFVGTVTDNNRDCMKKGRRPAPIGERHGGTKLTEKQAKEIKYSSLRNCELAEKYQIGRPAVTQIRNGTNWKYI